MLFYFEKIVYTKQNLLLIPHIEQFISINYLQGVLNKAGRQNFYSLGSYMKKIAYISLILCCYMLSSIAITYGAQDNHILFCPQQVVCSEEGQLKSCNPTDTPYPEYWFIQSSEGDIVKGVYNLKKVTSSYQSPELHGESKCQYNNIENGIERLITVQQTGVNAFEAFYDKTTQWNIVGYNAECLSNNPQSCLLIEKPELVFTSNGQWAADFYTVDKPQTPIPPPMSYDAAVSACNNMKQCELRVHTKSVQGGFDAGSIVIDLTNNNIIKVVKVTPRADALCIIEKKEPFNTIYCVKK